MLSNELDESVVRTMVAPSDNESTFYLPFTRFERGRVILSKHNNWYFADNVVED